MYRYCTVYINEHGTQFGFGTVLYQSSILIVCIEIRKMLTYNNSFKLQCCCSHHDKCYRPGCRASCVCNKFSFTATGDGIYQKVWSRAQARHDWLVTTTAACYMYRYCTLCTMYINEHGTQFGFGTVLYQSSILIVCSEINKMLTYE